MLSIVIVGTRCAIWFCIMMMTAQVTSKMAEIATRTESAERQAARAALAKRNLGYAKRSNEVGVCDTHLSFVSLTHVDGVYTLTKGCVNGDVVLACGKPAVVAPILGSIFKTDEDA